MAPIRGGRIAHRRLGDQGLLAPSVGLGCWGLSGAYGAADEAESLELIRCALDQGSGFFDTAEAYGPFTNEELLGRALAGRRDEAVIATKFGIDHDPSGQRGGLDSRPAHIRAAVEGSLRRLGTDRIDVLYQHRVDPRVPIEEVAGAVGELVMAGKARYFGLCEASAQTVRRANATFPVSVLQTEYSLWERGIEREVLPALRELGIGLVAYSPLGRGFLTGRALPADQYPEGDYRRLDPRFASGRYELNMTRTEVLWRTAEARALAPSQVAIAWLLHQGADVVPIPGTRQAPHVRENAAAADVVLDDAALSALGDPTVLATGARYPDWLMRDIE